MTESPNQKQMEEIYRYLDALNAIADIPVPGEELIAYKGDSSYEIAEMFVDWISVKQRRVPEGGRKMYLPDPDQLRDASALVESIANAIERRYGDDDDDDDDSEAVERVKRIIESQLNSG